MLPVTFHGEVEAHVSAPSCNTTVLVNVGWRRGRGKDRDLQRYWDGETFLEVLEER